MKKPESWSNSTGLARAILHDRDERRKWLFYLVLVPLGLLAIGLWVIDGWIWASPWRVLFWWGGCAIMTLVVLLFALYDALAVVREEREKAQPDVDKR
jgi:polyferredoxin